MQIGGLLFSLRAPKSTKSQPNSVGLEGTATASSDTRGALWGVSGPEKGDGQDYQARPKATPTRDRSRETHDRVRTGNIDRVGTVTLRYNGRLRHIGVGRTHAGTYIRLLVQDLDITIINATTGETLRELVLDPTRDYQPTGAPKGRTRK